MSGALISDIAPGRRFRLRERMDLEMRETTYERLPWTPELRDRLANLIEKGNSPTLVPVSLIGREQGLPGELPRYLRGYERTPAVHMIDARMTCVACA